MGSEMCIRDRKGEFIEADDFDAPLPDDLLAAFEGRDPDAPPVP